MTATRPLRPGVHALDLITPLSSEVGALAHAFVTDYYRFHTQAGVWNGWYANAGEVPDYSPAGVAAHTARLQAWDERIERHFDERLLSVDSTPSRPPLTRDSIELELLRHAQQLGVFRTVTWRRNELDPRVFADTLDVSVYLTRCFAPGRERLQQLTRYLRGVPEMLHGMFALLNGVYGTEVKRIAVSQYRQQLRYYEFEMRAAALDLATTDRERADLLDAAEAATEALRAFCEQLLTLPSQTTSSTLLGADRFAALLHIREGTTYPLERLLTLGNADLTRNLDRAHALADELHLPLREAFHALDTPFAEQGQVLECARQILTRLHERVTSAGLTPPLPPLDEARVLATPAFVPAGGAVVETPGLFDQPGLPAFVYLTLPHADASPAERAARLSRLSPWQLFDTLTHETYPGHLLHRSHLMRHPSEMMRAFPSYAALEGWAHYAEELAFEQGWHDGDPRFALAYLRMALVRNCRLLLTARLHSGQMTQTQAVRMIERVTGFSTAQARQEVARAVMDPGCFSYTLGKIALVYLRQEYARIHGLAEHAPPTLRAFHEAVFAVGAVPLPLLRQALIASAWDD